MGNGNRAQQKRERNAAKGGKGEAKSQLKAVCLFFLFSFSSHHLKDSISLTFRQKLTTKTERSSKDGQVWTVQTGLSVDHLKERSLGSRRQATQEERDVRDVFRKGRGGGGWGQDLGRLYGLSYFGLNFLILFPASRCCEGWSWKGKGWSQVQWDWNQGDRLALICFLFPCVLWIVMTELLAF